MDFRKQGLGILIVAMSLATAWAIRGQFGHEQGAAWAGAIGGLALVMVSGRRDWYNKMTLIALASAVGWGAGGVISYGRVVGYTRADNFPNALYGITMLFVIGGLFGLLGGGLVGMVLDSTRKNRVKWGALLAEMVAGGLVFYWFLVGQLEILMTPPRSEAWAMILGAGAAMLWHMARNNRHSPIRTAIYAAIGGGFGFAFGSFLQVMGNSWEVQFNMWNVMEYSIGFFGGVGMAFGVFTSKWPVDDEIPARWVNNVALGLLVIVIPLIVFQQSLTFEPLLDRFSRFSVPGDIARTSSTVAAITLLAVAVYLMIRLGRKGGYAKKDVTLFLLVYLGSYAFMSLIATGLFGGIILSNNYLYLVNIALIWYLQSRPMAMEPEEPTVDVTPKKWFFLVLGVLCFLTLLAFVAIHLHNGFPGSHNRF